MADGTTGSAAHASAIAGERLLADIIQWQSP
jgi:hypothetical protein